MTSDDRLARSAEPWETRIGVPESFTAASIRSEPHTLPGGPAYGPMIDDLREFLDAVAGASPDAATAANLQADLQAWTRRLQRCAVTERDQPFGHRVDLSGRGQVMAPRFVLTERMPDGLRGTVRFGRYFLGGNDAVHGGAVALLFDEVLGRLSNTDQRPPGRTAYLRVEFRAVTPVERDLAVRAWFDREEGRKRFLVGEIWDGQTLTAQGTGLFVALTDSQL